MRICTDLDGTLIDNRRAVVEAYRSVGAPDPTWGATASEELLPYQELKNQAFPEMLRKYAGRLPLGDLLLHFHRATGATIHILTSASEAGARCSLDFLGWPLNLPTVKLYSALSLPQRVEVLRTLGGGIYFDDSEVNLNVIRNSLEGAKSWQLCAASY